MVIKVKQDGPYKFQNYQTIKIGITAQNMRQTLNSLLLLTK